MMSTLRRPESSSMSSTRLPCAASDAPVSTDTVLLPVPPLPEQSIRISAGISTHHNHILSQEARHGNCENCRIFIGFFDVLPIHHAPASGASSTPAKYKR